MLLVKEVLLFSRGTNKNDIILGSVVMQKAYLVHIPALSHNHPTGKTAGQDLNIDEKTRSRT